MANFVWYVFLIAALALVAAGVVIMLRSYMAGTSPRAALFGPRPPPRLAVVDYANVDGRRRLVLVRRDDTEHLIMTGGPVDVLIETGIVAPQRPALEAIQPRVDAERSPVQPVFTRAPRTIAAAGETAAE
jgi:flagellar protein FliO/FliZ